MVSAMVVGGLAAGAGAQPQNQGKVNDLPGLQAEAASHGKARVVVELSGSPERGRIRAAQDGVLRSVGAAERSNKVQRLERSPLFAMDATAGQLRQLADNGGVASVRRDEKLSPALATSTRTINATGMWGAGLTGKGEAVAVIDTGVDTDHPMLAGRIIAQACFSGAASCPNGETSEVGAGAAEACTYAPGCDHGTHVAGIAAGDGDTLHGVGRGADIIAVQVFSNASSGLTAYWSDVLKGLEYVQGLTSTTKIASVNMSIVGGQYSTACDATNSAMASTVGSLKSAGIATVAAAGNNGYTDSISFPACLSDVIAVGSVNAIDGVSSFSNSSPLVDLLAPGEPIQSAAADGGTKWMSGTSMAAPHVAGAFAAMKQRSPGSSVSTLLDELKATGVSVTDTRNGLTFPRLWLEPTAVTPPTTEATTRPTTAPTSTVDQGTTLSSSTDTSVDVSTPTPTTTTTVTPVSGKSKGNGASKTLNLKSQGRKN